MGTYSLRMALDDGTPVPNVPYIDETMVPVKGHHVVIGTRVYVVLDVFHNYKSNHGDVHHGVVLVMEPVRASRRRLVLLRFYASKAAT